MGAEEYVGPVRIPGHDVDAAVELAVGLLPGPPAGPLQLPQDPLAALRLLSAGPAHRVDRQQVFLDVLNILHTFIPYFSLYLFLERKRYPKRTLETHAAAAGSLTANISWNCHKQQSGSLNISSDICYTLKQGRRVENDLRHRGSLKFFLLLLFFCSQKKRREKISFWTQRRITGSFTPFRMISTPHAGILDSASLAAACSASFLLWPSPCPMGWSLRRTSKQNFLLWSGPLWATMW